MRCENVANGLQQCGGHSANTWRTNCNNVANNLQQCCEHSTNAWRTNCNNATFKKQKPYFCNSKTPFLHVKNHTFVMRICNIQKTNTLRTFRECILNGLRMRGEHHEMDCKTFRNIPTYTHEMGCEPIANTWRTDCQTLLTVCQNAAKHAASFGTPHNNAPTYKHKKTYKIYNRI